MPEQLSAEELRDWIKRAIAEIRQARDIWPRPGWPEWRWMAEVGPLPEPWASPGTVSKSQLELAREKVKLEKQWLDALERHLDQRIEQTP